MGPQTSSLRLQRPLKGVGDSLITMRSIRTVKRDSSSTAQLSTHQVPGADQHSLQLLPVSNRSTARRHTFTKSPPSQPVRVDDPVAGPIVRRADGVGRVRDKFCSDNGCCNRSSHLSSGFIPPFCFCPVL